MLGVSVELALLNNCFKADFISLNFISFPNASANFQSSTDKLAPSNSLNANTASGNFIPKSSIFLYKCLYSKMYSFVSTFSACKRFVNLEETLKASLMLHFEKHCNLLSNVFIPSSAFKSVAVN